ncbi:MAG: calcium/sodium antiporter [Desulfobacteraceae bacterium]|nr:calcium/sodium antiporter [Desulfobacteraceae bacterium]
MTSVQPYLLLAIGFVLLVKGADFLVEGAGSIARRYNISDLVIGLTVVAFGTSAPELFVNIVASAQGNTAIAIGNVLGSNIANILLILGISALVYPLAVTRDTVWREIPFSLVAAVVLCIAANDRIFDGWAYSDISRSDGLIFLMFFAIFLYYLASITRNFTGDAQGMPMRRRGMPAAAAMTAAGVIGLATGGKLIVDGAVHIAASMGMSEAAVGLTIVAVGTSLPELATSVMAAWRKNVEIAVGNVVGSNIFNIFFVLGASAVIRPLPFYKGGNLDMAMVIAASLILFVTMFTGKRRSLERWEGALLLVFYAVYLVYLMGRG